MLINMSYICSTFGFLVTFVSLRYLDEALGLYMLIKKGIYIPVKEGAAYGFFLIRRDLNDFLISFVNHY